MLIAAILSDKWSRMRKSYLITLIIILIFSLPFTYGGCSGGGGSGGGSESAAEDAGIDVTLNVPYVPNHGNTCVTSSFTMLWENLTDFIEPWWEPTPAFLIISIDDPIPR